MFILLLMNLSDKNKRVIFNNKRLDFIEKFRPERLKPLKCNHWVEKKLFKELQSRKTPFSKGTNPTKKLQPWIQINKKERKEDLFSLFIFYLCVCEGK